MTSSSNQILSKRIICPVCKNEVTLEDTPLHDYIAWEFDHGFIPYDNISLQEFSDWMIKRLSETHLLDPAEKSNYSAMWACNKCIAEKRAIKGDLDVQLSKKSGMNGPIISYVSHNRTCEKCGNEFLFSADEQKHWYEELGFNVNSRPLHCPDCRKQVRHYNQKQKRLSELLSKKQELSKEELVETAGLFEDIGSAERAREFRGRAKNV